MAKSKKPTAVSSVTITDAGVAPDRVTVSMDRAIKHYGAGFSVFTSYATNLEPGESPQQAMARAQIEVKKFLDEAVARELEAQASGG